MESTSNRIRASGLLEEEEEHLSSFRKRNNRLILILFCLIILVGLSMAVIIISLDHQQYSESFNLIHSNPAINSFCSYTHSPFSCANFLTSITTPTLKTTPNQLFLLSLASTINDITNITLHIHNPTESTVKNCPSLIRKSLSQLSRTLRIFRVNPDVRKQTVQQRTEMRKSIIAAEQDLSSCGDELASIKSTGVSQIIQELYQANVYLRNNAHFLRNYRSVFSDFDRATASRYSFDFRLAIARVARWNIEYTFNVCMFVLQYVFFIGLFCALFRIC